MDKQKVLKQIDWLLDLYDRKIKVLEESDEPYQRGTRAAIRWCWVYLDATRCAIEDMDEKEPIEELADFCKRQMEEET